MRVMLDSPGWVELRENESYLESFRQLYNDTDIEVIFSIGNFLDLTHRDNQDELSHIIDEFADEYLAPLQLDLEGEYRYASTPMVLATIDAEWYENCREVTRGLDHLETLQTLFREAKFDDGPVLSRISKFVEEYSEIDAMDLEERLDIPEDTSPEVAIKKIRTFPSYTKRGADGRMAIEHEDIPLKRYVVGMSMIYISETVREPDEEDYRDAMIWSQAIIAGCDVLWTEREWNEEHPIIEQIIERLDRDELTIAKNFDEFEKRLN